MRSLERLLGAGGVVELALGVVVEQEQAQRRSRAPVRAKRSIGMSPFELPTATSGRRPMRLQMRIGFVGPSSKKSISDL